MTGLGETRSLETRNVKRIVGVAAIGLGGLGVLALIAVFGLITYRAGTGADPAEAFHEIPQVPEAFDEVVTWRPDGILDRAMEPTTRRNIESTWVRSWARLDIARQTGIPDGLETWFQGPLLDQVLQSVATRPRSSVTQHAHELQVEFYSLDGSVVGLAAVSDMQRQVGEGEAFRSIDTFEVVLLLSDGNWRLQSIVRAGTAVPAKDLADPPGLLASRDGAEAGVAGEVEWVLRRSVG